MGKMRFSVGVAILLFGLFSFSSAQLLGTACEPYGSITIRNEPAADNLPVVAYINGVEAARSTTLGGQYQVTIPKDNPDTPQRDGWIAGDVVVIRINGNQANPSFAAAAGRVRIDLVVNTLSVRLDTWGKIKALFK